jgi:hypothetical protein
MKNGHKRVTAKQIEKLAGVGVRLITAVFLEKLKLIMLTRKHSKQVQYRTEDMLRCTEWVEEILHLEQHLKCICKKGFVCYQTLNLRGTTGWLKDTISEKIVFGKYLEIIRSDGCVIYFSLDLTQNTDWVDDTVDEEAIGINIT